MLKINLVSLIVLFSSQFFSQSIMNIHQSNGTVLQIPLNTIDSITYDGINSCDATIIASPGNGVNYNGYNYSSVIIGNGQEWMAENRRTTTYANGDPIPNVIDDSEWQLLNTGAWCHYLNDVQYDNEFGKFYNFFAASDSRNVCPNGWHVPTNTDWYNLIAYLDPCIDSTWYIEVTSLHAAPHLKSVESQYWTDGFQTNLSQFNSIPTSFRYATGNFYNGTYDAFYWSNSLYNPLIPSNVEGTYFGMWDSLNNYGYQELEKKSGLNEGYCIRCLKD